MALRLYATALAWVAAATALRFADDPNQPAPASWCFTYLSDILVPVATRDFSSLSAALENPSLVPNPSLDPVAPSRSSDLITKPKTLSGSGTFTTASLLPTSSSIPPMRQVIFFITPSIKSRRNLQTRATEGFLNNDGSVDQQRTRCDNATVFTLASGQLSEKNGVPIYYSPGDNYRVLRSGESLPNAAVAITTTFADNQGILEFRNSSLPGGRATFCQDNMENLYMVFTGSPPNCEPVVLTTFGVELCQNGEIVGANLPTSADPTLSSHSVESQTTSAASNGYTQDVFSLSSSFISGAFSEFMGSSLDQIGISTSFTVSATTIAPGKSPSETFVFEISSIAYLAADSTSQTPLYFSDMSQPHEESTVAPPLDSSTELRTPLASTNLTAPGGSSPGSTTTRSQGIGSTDLVPGFTTTTIPGQPQRTGASASTTPRSPESTSTGLESGSIAHPSTGSEQGRGTSSSTEAAPSESSFGTTSATETTSSSTETDETTSAGSSSSTSSSSTSSSSTSTSSSSSSSTSSSSASSVSSSSSSSSTSAAATPVCLPGLDYSAAVYDLAAGTKPAHPVCAELLRTFSVSDADAMNLALVIENRVPLHTGRTPQGDGTKPILRTLWVDEANWDKPYSIYDYTAPSGKTSRYTCLVVMHRGYIRFPAVGDYEFTLISAESSIGEVDDNLYLWIGDTTPSGNFWPSNSVLSKLFQSEGNARKTSYFTTSTADELVPIRVFYANRLGPGRFRVDITGPSTPSLLSCTGAELDDWLPWEEESVYIEQN